MHTLYCIIFALLRLATNFAENDSRLVRHFAVVKGKDLTRIMLQPITSPILPPIVMGVNSESVNAITIKSYISSSIMKKTHFTLVLIYHDVMDLQLKLA